MGLLITNNGTMTLPCALLVLGALFMVIGQYRFNLEKETTFETSYENDETVAATTARAGIFHTSFFDKPLQWQVGSAFVILATTIIFFESDPFMYFKTYFKLSSSSPLSSRKNEDDVETEVMSKYYTHEEIAQQIRDIVDRSTQRNLGSKAGQQKRSGTSSTKLFGLQKESIIDIKKAICCLNALAFKIELINKKKKSYVVTNEEKINLKKNENDDEIDIFQTSQESSFVILRAFPDIDEIASSSLSLLALTAKSDSVRKRHLLQEDRGDRYNITLPIGIMKSSLERTKKKEHPGDCDYDNDYEEQLAAEVQRKACIYLGALSDGNAQLASQIVQNSGLESILACIDWFRCHLHVVNWALWAVFNLCFDHVGNKCEFVRLDGIGKVCRSMRNILEEEKAESARDGHGSNGSDCNDSDYLEVARHGIALFFDLLRYDPSSYGKSSNNLKLDFVHVRRVALNAGLHEILTVSMTKFPRDMQVMMMGQQMLIATGYNGEIPPFQGEIVRK